MLRKLSPIIFAIALAVIVIPTIVSAEEIKQSVTSIVSHKENVVNFELANCLIIVKTRIGNSSKEYNFALDTGSGLCLLNKGVAAEVGAKQIGQTNTTDTSNTTVALNQYQLDSISVGDNTVKDTPVLEVDLSGMSAVGGRKIDGIIGDSFLRTFCISIDYRKKQIIFSKSAPSTTGKYVIKTPERAQFVTISLPMTIDGKPTEGVVDTGSNSFVMPADFIKTLNCPKEELLYIKGSSSNTLFGSNAATKDMIIRIKSLEIGKFKLNNYPVNSYSGDAILLGYSFLSQFRMTIDYPNNTIMLTPYEDAAFPTNISNFGMTLGMNANRELIIASIYEGSFVDKQGANVGDSIIKINGKNVSDYKPEELAKIFGDTNLKELELTIKHDGKESPIKVKRDFQFPQKGK